MAENVKRPAEFSVEDIELFIHKLCRGAVPKDGDTIRFRTIKRGSGWVFEPFVDTTLTLLSGTFSWPRVTGFPANGFGNAVLSVSGVQLGDLITVNSADVPDQIGWTAYVSADDEVTIQWQNDSGSSVAGPLTISVNFQVLRS